MVESLPQKKHDAYAQVIQKASVCELSANPLRRATPYQNNIEHKVPDQEIKQIVVEIEPPGIAGRPKSAGDLQNRKKP